MLLEEPILSPCWNGLPQGTLPLYLNVKPKCLFLGACPPVGGYRKEAMNNILSLRLAILRDICKIMAF